MVSYVYITIRITADAKGELVIRAFSVQARCLLSEERQQSSDQARAMDYGRLQSSEYLWMFQGSAYLLAFP